MKKKNGKYIVRSPDGIEFAMSDPKDEPFFLSTRYELLNVPFYVCKWRIYSFWWGNRQFDIRHMRVALGFSKTEYKIDWEYNPSKKARQWIHHLLEGIEETEFQKVADLYDLTEDKTVIIISKPVFEVSNDDLPF